MNKFVTEKEKVKREFCYSGAILNKQSFIKIFIYKVCPKSGKKVIASGLIGKYFLVI